MNYAWEENSRRFYREITVNTYTSFNRVLRLAQKVHKPKAKLDIIFQSLRK